MTELIRQVTNTKFWYGIPAFAFDQALLWYPKEQVQRRRDLDGSELFSSWSWAGWKGACDYLGRGWYHGLCRYPVSVVHWVQQMDPAKFPAKLGDNALSGVPQGMTTGQLREDIFSGKWKLLEQSQHAGAVPLGVRGARLGILYDKERNPRGYTHKEYPGIVFNCPIPLPNQESAQSQTAKSLSCSKPIRAQCAFVT
jgi:hypothetical protein